MKDRSKKVNYRKLQEGIEYLAQQVASILLEYWLWQEKNKKSKKKNAN